MKGQHSGMTNLLNSVLKNCVFTGPRCPWCYFHHDGDNIYVFCWAIGEVMGVIEMVVTSRMTGTCTRWESWLPGSGGRVKVLN